MPSRTGTISVAGAGTCREGSAEGRLTWAPESLVRSVRVTAVVTDDETGGCDNFPDTDAVYTAYSGTTVVDTMEIEADNSVVARSFDLTGALTSIDRVEVSICWFPLVPIGSDPVLTCVVDSRRIS
ncbi:hypothetical protein [Virgisporangium ochraceum]|uniref:Uncharacterized protein n=1 Tax=Virgisporangium ochraceum TaxID=65505 RepID=A0A8J3ZXB9_9ACTN|nr:hypothetical protein [Virgisporangium ochraceum]GIJ70908.1 hypothetical protein Voc01_058250 [Virgisporangium ochraceum]